MTNHTTKPMIDSTSFPVQWALLLYELTDASLHLSSLAEQAASAGRIDEEDFRIQLAHVYAHTNRAWNARCDPRLVESPTEDEQDALRRFPTDVSPLA
jgi:hypothetical protein